jgi:hypothetical protein
METEKIDRGMNGLNTTIDTLINTIGDIFALPHVRWLLIIFVGYVLFHLAKYIIKKMAVIIMETKTSTYAPQTP